MILIDSNILIDLFTNDKKWRPWSETKLILHSNDGIAINPIIYAEISLCFQNIKTLEQVLDSLSIERIPLPFEAGFFAAKAFVDYKKRKGEKRSPLPDFYIGAHAQVGNLKLLTRDFNRYKTYFPEVILISPE